MRSILTIGFSALLSIRMFAHSDPLGEVHPRVVARPDGFEITSENNALSKEDSTYVVTRIFDRSGRLQSTSADIVAFRDDGQPQFNKLEEEEEGLSIRWGDQWLVVPNYERKHQGAPFVTLVNERGHQRRPLGWQHPDVSEVCDLLIEGESLYLLVTRLNILQEASLWIHKFSLRTWSEEAAICLPKPETIYVFPVCSGLVAYQGAIYVSLVRRAGTGFELVLNKWDGKASRAEETVLTRDIDWNTSVSMANRGTDLLIAYHQLGKISAMPLSYQQVEDEASPFRWRDAMESVEQYDYYFSLLPGFVDAWRVPKSTIQILHRDLTR